MKGSYLGTSYNDNQIEDQLKFCNAIYKKCGYIDMIDLAAEALKNSKSISWFQGRMEFGPRALSSKSIIADPKKNMQEKLNLKGRFRRL